jgi:3-oxoacyl-[acyl-carrier-protein] synthase-3
MIPNPLPPVGIAGTGIYIPPAVITGQEIAARTGLPEFVVLEKMGIRQIHIADSDDTVTAMASRAARQALDEAGLDPLDLDLIVYHGSEYKDHIVWSAAAKIQHLIGAANAYAFEMYALCAGAPIAYKAVRDMMRVDPRLENVLLVTASCENDLVDFANMRTRFMFNFGAGGGTVSSNAAWNATRCWNRRQDRRQPGRYGRHDPGRRRSRPAARRDGHAARPPGCRQCRLHGRAPG